MTRRSSSRYFPALAVLLFSSLAHAQLSITNGPSFGAFPVGPVQLPLYTSDGGGHGPYTWSITSGALPAGLSVRTDGGPSYFNPSNYTGAIVGVATTPISSASFTLTVQDGAHNSSAPKTFTMSVLSLAITDPNNLSDGIINVHYSYTPTVVGATGAVTWTLPSNNNLPNGLTLNTATGEISGTPTQQGNFGFSLIATDSTGTISRFFNIQVWGVGLSGTGDLGSVQIGSAVNITLTGTGGTPGYTFSAGGLPQGLTLSSDGHLTGTVTGGNGTYRFSVNVRENGGATFNKNVVLNIVGSPTLPSINAPSPVEDATLGESRTYNFNVNGGKGPYTWTISSGQMPPGMRLQTTNLPTYLGPDDAVIQGSPTQLGSFTFTISVRDSSSPAVTVSLQPITINVRNLSNDYPQNPTRDAAYSFYLRPVGDLDPSGDTSPYHWQQVGGSLPKGLSLDTGTGIISGTPLENGNFNIFVQISGKTSTIIRNIGINVNSPTTPSIQLNGNTLAIGDAIVNQGYGWFFGSCCSAVTVTLVGAPPPGLNLNANGQLSGTPTQVGQYTLEVHATDNSNPANFGVRFFTLNVSALSPNFNIPSGTQNSSYTDTTVGVTAVTGTLGTLTWTVNSGSQIPPGMTFLNGTLSGTPTSPGTYNVNFTVSDSGTHSSITGGFNLSVYAAGSVAPPTFNFGSNLGTAPIGEQQFGLGASGGNGTYTWAVVNGALPPGVALRTDAASFFSANQQAGLIGVATTAGNYAFTLSVTSGGQTSYQYCTVRITALNLMDGGLPPVFAGVPYSYKFTAQGAQGNVTFTQNNGSLPTGFTLASDGTLSGTTSQTGNFNFGFMMSDGTDTIGRGSGFNVFGVHFLTGGDLGNVGQNGSVNLTFTAAGGSGNYTYQGGAPPGLNLLANGTLSGVITAGPGHQTFNVTVTDTSTSQSYNKVFSFNVTAVPAQLPSISLGNLIYPDIATIGSNLSRLASVTSGTGPFNWQVTNLPPGLAFRTYDLAGRTDVAAGNIEIWGNPTTRGTYQVTYKVTDANNNSATVVSPMIVTGMMVDNGDNLPNGTINTPYSKTLRVIGGTPPYAVKQLNAAFSPFPDGVSLDTGTFKVSGTPLEAGNFNVVLQFTDAAQQNYEFLSYFNINGPSNINIGDYFNLGDVGVGSSFNHGFNACCANSYTWTVAGGSLPPGLTLTGNQLTGTATTAGTYTFLIKADAGSSGAGYKQFVLNVTPLSITQSTTLPYGTVNQLYTPYQIPVSGNTNSVTFTLGFNGPLPPGMSLSTSGVLSGTPTAQGLYNFNVLMSDSGGHTLVGYFTLGIYTTGPAVAITTGANLGTLPIGEIQLPLTAAGGNGVFTWSLVSGSLPPGLSLRTDRPTYFSSNAQAGIMGVATAPQSTPYTFTLKVTSDNGSQSDTLTFSLKITGLTGKENSGFRLADAFIGTPFTYKLSAVGEAGTVTFGSPQNLPPGLTLAADGTISGTPTTSNFYNFTYTINDTVDTVTVSSSIVVYIVNITNAEILPNATQNATYSSYTFNGAGGTAPYTFTGNGIPGGLGLSSAGVLSGTVNAGPGRYYMNITVTDSNHVSYTKVFALIVIGVPPALPFIQPYGNFDDCSFGMTCSRALAVLNGGAPPFTWTITGLPTGMTSRLGTAYSGSNITGVDVEVWGPPTQLGSFPIQAVVKDANNVTATQTFTLRVSPLIVDGSDYLPNGTRLTPYTKLLRVLGGTPTYSVQLPVPQELPAGLSLSGMTVSGTPQENGGFSPHLVFTDSAGTPNNLHITSYFSIGNFGTSTLNINNTAFGELSSNNDLLGTFLVGSSMSYQLNACCATSYSWSLIGGTTLPTGLSLSSGGNISGTPTTAGVYSFLVQVADASNSNNVGVRQYNIVITGVNITSSSPLPTGSLLTPGYSQQLSSNITAVWSVAPGFALPPGLTLSSSGLISGTLTTTGQYNFWVIAANPVAASTDFAMRQFSLSVYTDYPPLFLGTGPNVGPNSLGTNFIALQASGGKPPYHYLLTPNAAVVPNFRVQDGGQLPNGFTTNITAGYLGIRATAGSWPSSLRVTDSNGSIFDRPITVISSDLTILNPNDPPAAIAGSSYSYTFVAYGGANGGAGPYTWSATGLPSGISIGSNTGTISGTTTATGPNFPISIFVKDTSGTQMSFGFTLRVYPFAITTGQVLPQGTINSTYNQTLSAPSCGTGCSFTIIGGSLPNGLSLNSAGVISGTPTGFSNSTFLVQASGSNGISQREFALLVPFNTPQPLFITQNPNLYYSTVGNGYSQSLTGVQGGTPPYNWSVASGSLPPGVSLAGSGETIGFNFVPGFYYLVGKPMVTGNYTFTLKVTDGASNTVSQQFTWGITPLNFNMTTFPAGGNAGTYGLATPTPTYNTPYSQQILVVGGTSNYTFSALGAMPPGLTISSSGLVTGTPTATGNYSVLIQVHDDASPANLHQQFINFNVASGTTSTLSINTGPNLGTVTATSQRIINLNPSGGTGPYSFTVLDTLPPGCSLLTGNTLLGNANGNYDLSCTYEAPGSYTFTLKVTDSANNFGVRVFTIAFVPVQIYGNTSYTGSAGTAFSQTILTWDNFGAVTWSITPGFALPPGMTLTGATIAGTPSTPGNYSFTLTATDSGGLSANFNFSITISPITITDPDVIPVSGAFLQPFSYQFHATGGGATKTWSAPSVPSGLTLSPSGLLSGTLKSSSNVFTLTVTVADTVGGSITKQFALYSHYANPVLLGFPQASTAILDVHVGGSVNTSLYPTGGTAPYHFTVAPSSTLPPGIALYTASSLWNSPYQPGSTLIAGEATTVGQYSFDLIITDSAGAFIQRTFTLNVTPIVLQEGTLPNGTIGVGYSRQLVAVGGTGPYTFTYTMAGVNSPIFPQGISGSSSGLISGTPTSTGNFTFKLTITDSAGHSYSEFRTLTVTNVSGSSGVFVNSSQLFSPFAGSSVNSQLSVNNSSTVTYNWSLQGGTLPPGLDLTGSGHLVGSPSTPGTYTYTVRATNAGNPSIVVDRVYTAVVAPMYLDFSEATTLPPATVGTAYTYTFKPVGGTAPYTFATTPLYPLPPGLSLSSDGVLSGTPTANGNYSAFYMLVTDHAGFSEFQASLALNIVNPGQKFPFSAVNIVTHDGSVGVPYAVSLGEGYIAGGLIGGVAPITWSVAPGSSLPPGLTILPSANGVPAYLGGIPTAAGNYTYVLVATDAQGVQAYTQHNTVISTLRLSPKLLSGGNVGVPYSVSVTASGGVPPYLFAPIGSSPVVVPPGLSGNETSADTATITGTPTIPGFMDVNFSVTDSATPTPHTLTYAEYIGAIDRNGEAQGLGITPTDVILLSYVRTAPTPAPVPINFTATSGTIPFSAMVAGIPGASLSAISGNAPTQLTLSLDTSQITTAGVYAGVVAGYSPNITSGFVGIPVVLNVIEPPPCTYTLNPTSGTIAAGGGSGSFTVSTGSLCSWTAKTTDGFVTINPATASGTGPGTVQYSLGNNGVLSARPASIGVMDQTYSITQFGSNCALAISPSTISATYAGGTATVNVTTNNAACQWTASGLSATPTSGTGSGTVTFTIPPNANTSTQVLTAAVQLNGSAATPFTVTQSGISCTVGLSAGDAAASYQGGNGEVFVSTPATCAYNTANAPGWISVTSNASGNGPGPVALTYYVQPNSTTMSRSGSLQIGDQSFTITQAPAPCSVTVDASGSGSPFGKDGGTGTLAVTANGSNCTWTASSQASWLTISPSFGTGNGTPTVHADPNRVVASRSANLTVAGTAVAVSQGGINCSYALGSSTSSIPFGGGTGSVTVTSPTGCHWETALDPSASWLGISSAGSDGTSNVVFTAALNHDATARSGTLTIAGQPFVVTQAAGPCNYILSGTNAILDSDTHDGTFTFSTPTTGCSATALSFASWLTVGTVSSSDGTSGTVSFHLPANPSGASRSGTIQFAGQTFTVAQSGAQCAYSLNSYGLALGKLGGAGNVLASASAQSCNPNPGVDLPTIVTLGTLVGPSGGIYTLPFTVVAYNSTVGGVRRMVISFGGQFFTIKQTSW